MKMILKKIFKQILLQEIDIKSKTIDYIILEITQCRR